MLEAFALSDTGKIRSSNQDSYRIAPELGLYLVADGMGGARGGERASSLTVETVVRTIAESRHRDAAALLNAVEEANTCVFREAAGDPSLEGMGTTLVAVLETAENDVAIASVGDSRVYLFHNGILSAVTEDQSWVQEVGRPLGLDEASLKKHPMRHVLTMAIGVTPSIRIRYYASPIQKGDVILLSSDGLHGVVAEDLIGGILAEASGGGTLKAACEKLVAAAHDAGSPDNVTVLLIRQRADQQPPVHA
jgi:protein phosphatase